MTTLAKRNILRESMDKLGTIEIDETNKIRVNHPLYKINLIDPEYEKATAYLQKREAINGDYKDSLINRLPESPKRVNKTFKKKCEISPSFKKSTEFNIFSKIAKQKLRKKENFTNANTREQPVDQLADMGKSRFTSDYGVNYNKYYKYFEDDTM